MGSHLFAFIYFSGAALADAQNGSLFVKVSSQSLDEIYLRQKYERTDQVKPFKGCVPHILLGSFSNTCLILSCTVFRKYSNIYLSNKNYILSCRSNRGKHLLWCLYNLFKGRFHMILHKKSAKFFRIAFQPNTSGRLPLHFNMTRVFSEIYKKLTLKIPWQCQWCQSSFSITY